MTHPAPPFEKKTSLFPRLALQSYIFLEYKTSMTTESSHMTISQATRSRRNAECKWAGRPSLAMADKLKAPQKRSRLCPSRPIPDLDIPRMSQLVRHKDQFRPKVAWTEIICVYRATTRSSWRFGGELNPAATSAAITSCRISQHAIYQSNRRHVILGPSPRA